MTIRETILSAMETDWNISGIKKVWKYLPVLEQMSDSDFPSIHIQFGTETAEKAECNKYVVPVFLIVFFKSGSDLTNAGYLRAEAEKWIDAYKSLSSQPTLNSISALSSLEYQSATPYLTTGIANRGFLIIEFKLIYIGD